MWGDALHLCKWHVQPLVLLLLLQCAVVAYILIMRLVLCYTYFTLLPFHISSQQRATRNPRGTCPATQPISQPLYHPTDQTTDHPSFASLHCLHVKWVRGLTRTQRPSFVRGGWFKKKGGGGLPLLPSDALNLILSLIKKCSYFCFTLPIPTTLMDFYARVILGNLLKSYRTGLLNSWQELNGMGKVGLKI